MGTPSSHTATMRSSSHLLCAAVLSGVLAACASLDTAHVSEPLPEGRWELLTTNFIESGRMPGLARATLELKDGRLAAYSGCNRALGTVTGIDGRLSVANLESSRRDCPEPIGSFDARYFTLLKERPVYRVEGDTLLLIAGDYYARFRKR